MDTEVTLRTGDMIALGIYLVVIIWLGVRSAVKSTDTEGYFFGGRSMPGWAVAISVLGTAISSVTFLAYPGSAYSGNWSLLAQGLAIPIPAIITVLFIVPFYRRHTFNSAYEYFEHRFGTTWPRTYSSILWTLSQVWRMGSILYLLVIPFKAMTGWDYPTTILAVGMFVTLYTVIGGIEAVIWTDAIQTVVLILGGIVCVITVFVQIDGGPNTVLTTGADEDKFSINLTLTDFSLVRNTFWAIMLSGIINNFHEFGVDQTKIQRYAAPKTKRGAVNAVWTGALGAIPVWTLFMFVGTCLYVFYQRNPALLPEGMKSDAIFPYFILHQVPEGLGGFVIAAVLGAAMSSLDSSLNGTSSTVTNDLFRQRVFKGRSDRFYLNLARVLTFALAGTMMLLAYTLTLANTDTFLELGLTVAGLMSGGLGGMFFLAFFTTRANNLGIIFGIIAGVILSVYMVIAEAGGVPMTSIEVEGLPKLVAKLLFGAVANCLVVMLGYFVSYLAPAPTRESLTNLTWWTMTEEKASAE
jgi:SSS family solute:Na+ symporter